MIALIAGGASPNVADNEGNTPLHLCNSPELMTALLEAEADPNARNKVGAAEPNLPPPSTVIATAIATAIAIAIATAIATIKPTFVAALPFYTPPCP